MREKVSAVLVRGDGIGPDVIDSAVEVLSAAGGTVDWIVAPAGEQAFAETGSALPRETVELVKETGLALKGPMTVPMSGYPSPNQGLRDVVRAFANVRGVRYYPHRGHARYPGMDLTIIRDVTEDLTRGASQMTDAGEAGIALKVTTRAASERLAEFAYDWALANEREKVTIGHLAPSQRATDGIFLQAVLSVADRYPGLRISEEAIDPLCVHLLQDPSGYQVLLTPNVYGGILCGLLGGLAGTVGVMPGGNYGLDGVVFEAGHGSAPKYSGTGSANPIGCILSGAMLLDHAGQADAAHRVHRGVYDTIAEGVALTRDLGGNASTAEFTKRCVALIER